MALPLITKAEYKAHAGISSVNKDTEIDALIPRVSALVKNYCRRSFIDYVNTDIVEYFNGPADYLPLKEFPIIEVSGVEISTDYGETYTLLAQYTDYVLDIANENIKSLSTYGFVERINGYRVTYRGGYTSIPDDLKLAVIDLVTYYIKNDSAIHSNKAPGTSSVQIEYISTTSLPAHIKRVLDLYAANYL